MKIMAIFFVVAAIVGAGWGCAIFGAAERAEVASTLNTVEQCQEKGRQGPEGGHLRAYDQCMQEAGLHDR